MIVDSSALIAIVLAEPEKPIILRAISQAPSVKISAATWLETFIVVDDLEGKAELLDQFHALLAAMNLRIIPVDESLARIARAAHQTFGRGNHSARLNFGDCFSYALAKQTGEPLLFKGNDFRQTDIIAALP